jgi:hypothetical protein
MQPPGKTENDPLSDDEFVLRTIHKNQYKSGRPFPVASAQCQPHPTDKDGLSVYRECFVSPRDLAMWGAKGGNYYVARVSVAVLRAPPFNLTIDPTPDPDPTRPRGHSSIRELSIGNYLADEHKGNDLAEELRKLLSKNIAFVPPGCPR